VFQCFGVSVRAESKNQPLRTAPCPLHRNTARRSRNRNTETPVFFRLVAKKNLATPPSKLFSTHETCGEAGELDCNHATRITLDPQETDQIPDLKIQTNPDDQNQIPCFQSKPNTVMKTLSLSLLATAIAAGVASAATAYTTPVGYVSLGNTTGGDAFPANTDIRVSIPLFNPIDGVATIATGGINGSVLTIDGAAYTADEWIGYYAVVTSGSNNGQILLVTDNDATTLTVMTTTPGDTLAGLADGNTLDLSLAWTIGSAIGNVPVGTQLLGFSGNGVGQNVAADALYSFGEPFPGFFGGVNQWYNALSLQPAANEILFPGESLLIRTGASPITSLVVAGAVSTANSRTVILGGAGSQDTTLAFVSPVGQTVINAGIPAVPGDQILLFDVTSTGQNQAASTIYAFGEPFPGFFGGVNKWYNSLSLQALTTESLPGGESYIYRTAGAATDTVWSGQPDFVD
jgi:uncharacterized protein (TIGR02597 family)